MYIQLKNFNTFVYTNFVVVTMKIEDAIKSTTALSPSKRTILNIMYTQNVLSETFNEVLKPHDLSTEQFNVLRILRGQKGKPANLSTLNERMVTKMSNTTRLVDKLILKGYVERMVCPSNRRKVEINITPTGESALSLMDLAMKESEEKLLENFSPDDLWSLNKLLDKF